MRGRGCEGPPGCARAECPTRTIRTRTNTWKRRNTAVELREGAGEARSIIIGIPFFSSDPSELYLSAGPAMTPTAQIDFRGEWLPRRPGQNVNRAKRSHKWRSGSGEAREPGIVAVCETASVGYRAIHDRRGDLAADPQDAFDPSLLAPKAAAQRSLSIVQETSGPRECRSGAHQRRRRAPEELSRSRDERHILRGLVGLG